MAGSTSSEQQLHEHGDASRCSVQGAPSPSQALWATIVAYLALQGQVIAQQGNPRSHTSAPSSYSKFKVWTVAGEGARACNRALRTMDHHKRPAGDSGGAPGRKRGPGAEEDDMIDDPMDDLDMLEDMEQPQPPEDEDVDLGEAGRNWVRPEVPAFDPATTALGACLWPKALRGGGGMGAMLAWDCMVVGGIEL